MVDHITPAERSALMSKVPSRNTTPELKVRRLLHRLGYRFRLHRRDLPGSPDIVFSSKKKIIFFHGCYWHRHADCNKSTIPKSNTRFWLDKFEANVRRDEANNNLLKNLGWGVLVIWQCETKNIEDLTTIIQNFLDDDR